MTRQQRGFWRPLVILTLAYSLSACAVGPPRREETSQSWQEEVQLQDGRVIIAERTEYYSAYCGPGVRCGLGKRGGNTRSKIEFGNGASRIVWEEAMRPMILQLNQNSPIVIARFANQAQVDRFIFKEGGEPGVEYLAFRYDDRAWRRIPLRDADVSTETNLLIGSQDAGFWVSLAEKKKSNGRIGLSDAWRRVPLN